jgi:hypothetical protein
MERLRKYYDRVAALIATLFLFLSVVLVFQTSLASKEKMAPLQKVAASNDNKFPADKALEVAEASKQLQTPPQWSASITSGLFVPEKHFIGADGVPATLRNAMLHPPVPNEWLEELGLPITEADVLTQDPDGDGFTNLDEWLGHSNALDRDSHPPYVSKLKLRSFAQDPFPLIFSSSVEDTYAINNVDPSLPTQFRHLGELVEGTRYRLKSYREKHARDQYGTVLDVSELTLEQTDSLDLVTLVKEKRAISPESVANFLYTWSEMQQSFAVKKDQEFSLKPRDDVRYRLLGVESTKATIVDTQRPEEAIDIEPIN